MPTYRTWELGQHYIGYTVHSLKRVKLNLQVTSNWMSWSCVITISCLCEFTASSNDLSYRKSASLVSKYIVYE